ncbi:MAG: DNA repair protein RadC [Gemmatimonadota bacterium]|nr:MAG: DNA repair protein RadC [Gemmatimonadota bacterium]
MRDMPRVKKPRERLMEKGPEALKDYELLAILLRVGCEGKNVLDIARRILSEYPLQTLTKTPLEKMRAVKGIGPAKACTIKAAFELSKRAFAIDQDTLPTIKKSKDVADEVVDIRRLKREHFVVLYLNARNQLIHKEIVSVGTLNANIVHPREVFQPAVMHSAASIILVHNHPSGDTSPSNDDVQLTKRMVKAGEMMGIEVLDHVIVSERSFLSLKEKSLLP